MSDFDPEVDEFDEEDLKSQEELGDDSEGRKKLPWEKFSDDIEKEKADVKQKLGETLGGFGIDKDTSLADGEGLYRGGNKKEVSASRKRRKKLAMMAGGGVVGIVGGIIGLFGLFANFKLDFLLENLDAAAFTRINATFDGRSDAWIRKYIQVRLSEFNGESEPGETYFRATNVDNDNPFRDWFRTMRTNNYMDNMLQKNGITFVNRSNVQGLPSFAIMRVNGEDFGHDPENFRSFLSSNNQAELQRIFGNGDTMFDVDLNRPGSNQAARKAIKKIVHEESRFFNVIQRRHTRKAIQNVAGIREWRFFETTRDRIDAKKFQVKAKFFEKMFPDPGVYAKAFGCLFGFSACPKTTDPASSDARASGDFDGDNVRDDDNPDNRPADTVDPETGQPTTVDENVGRVTEADRLTLEAQRETFDPNSPSPSGGRQTALDNLLGKTAGKFVGKILEKFNLATAVVGVASTLKTVSTIHENIESGDVDKIAQIAKGANAAQTYATLRIIQDQVKSRDLAAKITLTEDQRVSLGLDASEVFQLDEMMELISGAERSEGFEAIMRGVNQPGVANAQGFTSSEAREQFCDRNHTPEENEFAFLCSGLKIGGASPLSEWYAGSSLSEIMGAASSVWNTLDSIPGVSFLASLSDRVGEAMNSALSGVLSRLGFNYDEFVNSIMERIIVLLGPVLGIVPLVTETSIPGEVFNAAVQGGGYSAESQTRYAGGVLAPTTSAEYQYTEKLAQNYMAEKYDDMSLYDRYVSLDNMSSVASRTLFSTMTTFDDTSFVKSLSNGSVFGSFGSALMGMFSGSSSAAVVNSPQELAGIPTYAHPQQCIEMDPANDNPLDWTNADAVFPDLTSSITWGLLGDEEGWAEALYGEAGDDRDQIAAVETIYNCLLLDKQVAGGLGYLGNYTEDGGYGSTDDSTDPSDPGSGTYVPPTIPAGDTSNMTCPTRPNITDAGVADGYEDNQLYRIRLCAVYGIPVNATVVDSYYDLFTAMQGAGYSYRGTYSFRTMEAQIELRRNNGCPDIYDAPAGTCRTPTARPGYSNHQMATAADIVCNGSLLGNGSGGVQGPTAFEAATLTNPCLAWVRRNSTRFNLVLQCDGAGRNGGPVNGDRCESWHISPDGQ